MLTDTKKMNLISRLDDHLILHTQIPGEEVMEPYYEVLADMMTFFEQKKYPPNVVINKGAQIFCATLSEERKELFMRFIDQELIRLTYVVDTKNNTTQPILGNSEAQNNWQLPKAKNEMVYFLVYWFFLLGENYQTVSKAKFQEQIQSYTLLTPTEYLASIQNSTEEKVVVEQTS